MVLSVLKRLEMEGRLKDCCITLSSDGGSQRQVLGKDITGISRSSITFLGGESGREKLSAPVCGIGSITISGSHAFRRKERIDRVYPRGGRR